MRHLLRVTIPTDVGNDLAVSGTLGETLESILRDVKAEAAYFTAMDGERTGIIIVDISEASQIPAIGEPFYLALNATVEMYPCMLPEDLAKAGPAIARAAQKYGEA